MNTPNTHTIGTMITALHSKARDADVDLEARPIALDATHRGLVIQGDDQAVDRAVKFAAAYFEKYIAPRTCATARYHFRDCGVAHVVEDVHGKLYLVEPEDVDGECTTVRLLDLVTYPR